MASEATEPVTPASARAKVRVRGPTLATMARTRADSRPECSATATPSITVRMTPSGGKSVKFFTASVIIRCSPSAVRRLSTRMVSPVSGWIAVMPRREPTQLVRATTPARMTKSQNGSGSLLPIVSMAPRNPRELCRGLFVLSVCSVGEDVKVLIVRRR